MLLSSGEQAKHDQQQLSVRVTKYLSTKHTPALQKLNAIDRWISLTVLAVRWAAAKGNKSDRPFSCCLRSSVTLTISGYDFSHLHRQLIGNDYPIVIAFVRSLERLD